MARSLTYTGIPTDQLTKLSKHTAFNKSYSGFTHRQKHGFRISRTVLYVTVQVSWPPFAARNFYKFRLNCGLKNVFRAPPSKMREPYSNYCVSSGRLSTLCCTAKTQNNLSTYILHTQIEDRERKTPILEVGHPGIWSRDINFWGTVLGIYLHFLRKIRFLTSCPGLIGVYKISIFHVLHCPYILIPLSSRYFW